jgi:hypothetical protein
MAAIRNTAIGLLRQAGRKNIVAAGRYFAAHPWETVGLLGVRRDNRMTLAQEEPSAPAE